MGIKTTNAVEQVELPAKPSSEWMIWGPSYSLPDAAMFVLNFLGRNWFDTKLPPAEALTLVRLLVTLYGVQKQGLLLSKKDVMRAIDAEHISTAKRYTDLAIDLGYVTTQKAKLDSRIQLLYLTPLGQKAVEHELEIIAKSARWLLAGMGEYRDEQGQWVTKFEFKDGITVEPTKLEQLAIVNDELVKAPPGSVASILGAARADDVRREAWLQDYTKAERRYRPLSGRRWVAAYSETLRFDEMNREALDARSETNARMLGEYDAAFEDLRKLVKIDPHYLARKAELHVTRGDLDQAVADINELLRLRPGDDHPRYRMTRAQAYAKKGDWAKAAHDIDAAVAQSKEMFGELQLPGDWELLRGVVFANVGRVEEAKPALETARDWAERGAAMWEKELGKSKPLPSVGPETLRELRDDCVERIAYIDRVLNALRTDVRQSTKEQSRPRASSKRAQK